MELVHAIKEVLHQMKKDLVQSHYSRESQINAILETHELGDMVQQILGEDLKTKKEFTENYQQGELTAKQSLNDFLKILTANKGTYRSTTMSDLGSGSLSPVLSAASEKILLDAFEKVKNTLRGNMDFLTKLSAATKNVEVEIGKHTTVNMEVFLNEWENVKRQTIRN